LNFLFQVQFRNIHWQQTGVTENSQFLLSITEGPVAKKPSETQDKPHFQRHSCPRRDFQAGNAKYGIFSRKFPLGSTESGDLFAEDISNRQITYLTPMITRIDK
jgi:hypothetical protein